MFTDIIRIWRKEKHTDFVQNRLQNKETLFHDLIKRRNVLTFNSNVKKTLVKNKKLMDVNQDILGKLTSVMIRTGKDINFQKGLHYP